jgi:hypothetical protein
MRGLRANSPITAIAWLVASGSTGTPSAEGSLRSSTIDWVAASRASTACPTACTAIEPVALQVAGPAADAGAEAGRSLRAAPARSASRRTRSAAVARVLAGRVRSCTAATSDAVLSPCGPGISRSRPAAIAGTMASTAPQSEITAPSKPHSSRSTSVSSQWCSAAWMPLTRLYAHITVHGCSPTTTRSKAGR